MRLPDLVIQEVSADVVLPLRHRVLRAGRPPATAVAPQDERPGTWHLAAYAGSQVVGVVTFFAEPDPEQPARSSERFRGMAVDEAWRGRGIGQLLMREARDRLSQRGVQSMWAHGRDSALGFYEKIGFRVIGDGFIDQDTGIGHHIVVIELEALQTS